MYPSLRENQAYAQSASAEEQVTTTSSTSLPAPNGTMQSNGEDAPQQPPRSHPPAHLRRSMSSPPPGGFHNAVYWPSRRVRDGFTPASTLPVQHITHLFYSYAALDYDGTVRLPDEQADLELNVDGHRGGLEACFALKKQNPALRIILSIGGPNGSEAFSYVAPDDGFRRRFSSCLNALIRTYKFDGVEISWIYPKDNWQGEDLIKLLAATRGVLPKRHGYTVTAALAPSRALLKNIELHHLTGFVDHINLMTFGFTSKPKSPAGHHAQLLAPTSKGIPLNVDSCQSAVNYLQEVNFDLAKVRLGIPCYGQAFIGATRAGDGFMETRQIPYRDLPLAGSEEYVDRIVSGAYCYDNNAWVSYDCPETVSNKALFARMWCLRGLFFWDATGDRTGSDSLISHGYDVLLKPSKD